VLVLGILCSLAAPSTSNAWVPPPGPGPVTAPTKYQSVIVDGVDLGKAWVDMANWADLEISRVRWRLLTIPRPEKGQLPRNLWGKPVGLIQNFGWPYRTNNLSSYAMFEVESCRTHEGYSLANGVSACIWNLRVISPFEIDWREPEPVSKNLQAWMDVNFNPEQVVRLIKRTLAQGTDIESVEWRRLGSVEADVKANSIPVTLYRGTTCQNVQDSILRLASFEMDVRREALKPRPPVDGRQQGYPPNPPLVQNQAPHTADTFTPKVNSYLALGDWATVVGGTGNITEFDQVAATASANAPLYQPRPRPDLMFLKQMEAEIALIIQSCTGETVPLPDTPVTLLSVSSPASP
jgi:hypothetical protein